MSLEPVTGLNTINNLLWVFKLKIPLDAPVIRLFTKAILTRELNLYFKKLRNEDEALSFEEIEQYSEDDLDLFCFRRGIEIQNKSREKKIKDLKLWMAISNLRNVPHSLLLFSRITDYTQEEFFEDKYLEDEYEVLRKVSHSYSYDLLFSLGWKWDILRGETESLR